MTKNRPRDLRAYARQTSTRLILGGLLLLFMVGDGLIFLVYGPNAAITGLLCLALGLFPVALILLVFGWIDWIVKNARKE